MSSSSRDRVLIVASAAVAAFAVVARLHDVAAYPAIRDFDASGHAVSALDILEGHLPNPRSWSGAHPPVFYAICAALWAILPDAVPVHVIMRTVSVAAFLGTVWLVWRALRRLVPAADAAVISALLLGVPGFVIASIMMTNDPLCAFFVTAALVRMLEAPPGVPSARHAAGTAVLAALAAATKMTGIAAVGMTGLFYAWRSWRMPALALRNLAVVGVVTALIAGPHVALLFLSLEGSPYSIIGGRAGSQEKETIGLVVYEVTKRFTPFPSIPVLLHAAFWGDPTSTYLPRNLGWPLTLVAAGGLLVVALGVAGVVRLCRERELAGRTAVVLVFGTLYALALFPLAYQGPYIILTKTNYMLPGVLPASIVLAAGLGMVAGAAGTAVRVALLVVAAGGLASTWYDWWEPAHPAAPVAGRPVAPRGSAARTVEDWFDYRARDPIRALRLLAPQAQLAHELRVVRVLGLPFAGEGRLAPDDERSLELARARVAWLELHNLVRWIEPMATGFSVVVLDAVEQGDTATVRVRVQGLGATAPPGVDLGLWPFPPFEQQFTLARAGGAWWITGIEQTGGRPENAVQTFAAHPTQAGLTRLRELGWRGSWERPIAAVLAGPAG